MLGTLWQGCPTSLWLVLPAHQDRCTDGSDQGGDERAAQGPRQQLGLGEDDASAAREERWRNAVFVASTSLPDFAFNFFERTLQFIVHITVESGNQQSATGARAKGQQLGLADTLDRLNSMLVFVCNFLVVVQCKSGKSGGGKNGAGAIDESAVQERILQRMAEQTGATSLRMTMMTTTSQHPRVVRLASPNASARAEEARAAFRGSRSLVCERAGLSTLPTELFPGEAIP